MAKRFWFLSTITKFGINPASDRPAQFAGIHYRYGFQYHWRASYVVLQANQ